MLEEVGVVSAVQQQSGSQLISVQTQIKSTCGSCEAQSNCGTGAIAKVLASKPEDLQFYYDGRVSVGQKVKLGIPEQSLLKASSLVYLLPLVALLFAAVLAELILPKLGLTGESWVILFAFIAAAIAFKCIGIYMNNRNYDEFHPQILSVMPLEPQNIQITSL